MHYKTPALSYLLLTIISTGCGAPSANQPKVAREKQPASCIPTTIEEYCATRKCASYDEEVALVHKPRKNRFYFSVGTCGEYRFVTMMEGMGAGTDYFDSTGRLVGTAAAADSPMCNGEMSNVIGVGSACSEQVVESGGHQDE